MYEETLEDNGRFNEQPVLPFNAYGTIAMARSEFEANDGSSQIFFLLKVPTARCCDALTAALDTAAVVCSPWIYVSHLHHHESLLRTTDVSAAARGCDSAPPACRKAS